MIRRRLIHNLESSNERRKQLRQNLTSAEALLWTNLKKSQLEGKKFRRQHGVGPYIVDFFCPECRLAVELDGERHMSLSGAEADERRTEFLKRFNVRLIRFENREVFDNLEGVLDEIRRNLK
jgi:very-short-patch-repair endonuclease